MGLWLYNIYVQICSQKNQIQLDFILRYMKNINTCDMISLIECIFKFGEKLWHRIILQPCWLLIVIGYVDPISQFKSFTVRIDRVAICPAETTGVIPAI